MRILDSLPTPSGEYLWEVHHAASYDDADTRLAASVPVDVRLYVLARTREDAERKAKPLIRAARREYAGDLDAGETTCARADLRSLLIARDSSRDGRNGYRSHKDLERVDLACKDDARMYRLGVCLIPVARSKHKRRRIHK